MSDDEKSRGLLLKNLNWRSIQRSREKSRVVAQKSELEKHATKQKNFFCGIGLLDVCVKIIGEAYNVLIDAGKRPNLTKS
jgi:hypothetical protein